MKKLWKFNFFPYLAFGAAFKNFVGLFQFFWDPWCIRSVVVCKILFLNRISPQKINKPKIPFYFTVLPIYLNHLKLFENSRIFVTLLFRLGALNWKLSQILKATTCSCSTVARVLTKLQVPKKFDLRIFLRKYHKNCLGVIVSVLIILDFIDIKSSFKHKAF